LASTKKSEVDRKDDELEEELDGGARAFWSGTITFGLVSIPVDLWSASRPRQSLRMIGPDGAPVRRIYVCPKDQEPVSGEDLIRAYETEKGKLVTVTDEELESLEPKKSRDIDLQQFVAIEQLPPLLFERAYYLAPAGSSTKAYRLLAQTMEESGRAGIATFVMRGRSYLIAILAEQGVLRAETLRYADEVRDVADLELDTLPAANARTVKKMKSAIAKLVEEKFDPKELEDDRTEKIRALAEKKIAKKKDVVEVGEGDEGEGAEVVDLAALLRERLGVEVESAKRTTKRRAAKKKR
jgi:DNA end-binding protein Ku